MKHNPIKHENDSIRWLKLLISMTGIFALFHWTAAVLGSDRGQFGVFIGLLVVAATVFAEKSLFGKSLKDSAKAVGLTLPTKTGLLTAIAVSVLMLLTVLVFASVTGSSFDFYPNWYLLIPGLFFQAGIAEETLFRGYLFGHIRQKYSFRKAAVFAALPFILVHLILFYSLPWAIAVASILLSVVMSFPLSRLFELGGNTIWAPAIIHFVVQGTVKVLVASGEAAGLFPFIWIAGCALIPLLVFAVPNPIENPKE